MIIIFVTERFIGLKIFNKKSYFERTSSIVQWHLKGLKKCSTTHRKIVGTYQITGSSKNFNIARSNLRSKLLVNTSIFNVFPQKHNLGRLVKFFFIISR